MNKRENIGDEYMLEVKELQYFVVCADLLSFSKAADVLYTTQPNVSKVVKSLEEKLGFAVFDRDNRGIRHMNTQAVYLNRRSSLHRYIR